LSASSELLLSLSILAYFRITMDPSVAATIANASEESQRDEAIDMHAIDAAAAPEPVPTKECAEAGPEQAGALEEEPPQTIQKVPTPPFSEDDPYHGGSEGRIPCFFPGCIKHFGNYKKLSAHIQNKTSGHNTSAAAFKGTFFHTQFNYEISAYQKSQYAKSKGIDDLHKRKGVPLKVEQDSAAAADASGATHVFRAPKAMKTSQASSPSNAITNHEFSHVKHELDPGAPEAATRDHPMVTDIALNDFTWKAKLCWVKCYKDGTPLEHFESKGLARMEDTTQSNINRFFRPKVSSACAIQVCNNRAMESAPQVFVDPLQMLTDMHQDMQDRNDTTKWIRTLPQVGVKQSYLECDTPPVKGEGDCQRAKWPKEKLVDAVDVDDYSTWLHSNMNKKEGLAGQWVMGASRVLGMLDVSPEDLPKTDVQIMVALFQSKQHTMLLASPLLKKRFYWTATLLNGFINYAKFHERTLVNRSLQGDACPFNENYRKCLSAMVDDLRMGNLKRCAEAKDLSIGRKLDKDRALLKKFPKVDRLQEAVRRAYMTLQIVVRQTIKQGFVTRRQRGLMNQVIALAYHFDTFGGRKWELEHAGYHAILKIIEEMSEVFMCKNHKTLKTYGELAKLITPGLLAALSCYNEAPRPDGFEYFLVPAVEGSKCVSISNALAGGCHRFLPDEEVWPTNLLTRKFVHKKLIALTKDEKKLKQMMVILDGHSLGIIDKHYLLKDPEDDIILAKALVNAVFGTTVTWPTEADIAAKKDECPDWFKLANDIANGTECLEHANEDELIVDEAQDEEYDDDDEVPMEPWSFGHLFGIAAPGELELLPLIDATDPTIPLQDEIENTNDGEQATMCNGENKYGVRDETKDHDADKKPTNDKKGKKDKKNHRTDKDDKKKKKHKHSDKTRPLAVMDIPASGSASSQGSTSTRKKYQPIAAEKLKLYEEYTEHKEVLSVRRSKVDKEAKDWMKEKLIAWQTEEGTGPADKPFLNEWYLDARVDCIRAGLITKLHCPDVVRSFVADFVKKQIVAPADNNFDVD
jgi:hypothetical protein